MRKSRLIAVFVMLGIASAIWIYLYEWAAVDGCMDRGGQILPGDICSNGEDPPWPLYSLVHPIGMVVLAVIAGSAVAIPSAVAWFIATRNRRGRSDA